MTFVVFVLVFAIVQYWGSAEPVHKDDWFWRWGERSRSWFDTAQTQLLIQVLVPVVALWLTLSVLAGISSLLLFAAAVVLLLYSLGRGDFNEWVRGYTEAYHRNDNEVATEYAVRLGVDVDETHDWGELHRKVLRQTGYRGFERWFIAIFWFVLLGPMGAIFYRLASLALANRDNSEELRLLAQRLIWLLEWPAARVLGLTFAFTGNFVGCFLRWRECLLCVSRSTEEVLEHYIHGALSVNSREVTSESITEQEVEALLPLLSRTLILWLCVLALLTVV